MSSPKLEGERLKRYLKSPRFQRFSALATFYGRVESALLEAMPLLYGERKAEKICSARGKNYPIGKVALDLCRAVRKAYHACDQKRFR